MFARRWGRHTWGRLLDGYRISFWSDGNVLKLDRSDGCTTLTVLNTTEGIL